MSRDEDRPTGPSAYDILGVRDQARRSETEAETAWRPMSGAPSSCSESDGETLGGWLRLWRLSLDEFAGLRRRIRELERRESEMVALSDVPRGNLEERTFESWVLPEHVRTGPELLSAERRHLERMEEVATEVPSFAHRPAWSRPFLRLAWKLSAGLQRVLFRPQRVMNSEVAGALRDLAHHVERIGGMVSRMAARTAENFEAAQHRDLVLMNSMGSAHKLLRALEQRLVARSDLELARHEETFFRHRLGETSVRLEEARRVAEAGGHDQARHGDPEMEAPSGAEVSFFGSEPSGSGSSGSHADAGDVYLRFEDRFRGSQDEIRKRLEHHLDVLEQHFEANENTRIFDLGCGRGEWLELLEGSGYAPTGIDYNAASVARCRESGVEVIHGDVFEELARMENGSVDCITAFHLVEHMPAEVWMDLVGEVLRVLRSGGLFLVETPNPENLVVGGHTFWLDVTHEKPIAPDVMIFALETVGFTGLDLHRLRGKPPLELGDHPLAESLEPLQVVYNQHFAVGLDYSIHCRKP